MGVWVLRGCIAAPCERNRVNPSQLLCILKVLNLQERGTFRREVVGFLLSLACLGLMGKKLSHTVNGVSPTGPTPIRSASELSFQYALVRLDTDDSDDEDEVQDSASRGGARPRGTLTRGSTTW